MPDVFLPKCGTGDTIRLSGRAASTAVYPRNSRREKSDSPVTQREGETLTAVFV